MGDNIEPQQDLFRFSVRFVCPSFFCPGVRVFGCPGGYFPLGSNPGAYSHTQHGIEAHITGREFRASIPVAPPGVASVGVGAPDPEAVSGSGVGAPSPGGGASPGKGSLVSGLPRLPRLGQRQMSFRPPVQVRWSRQSIPWL